MEKRTGEYGVTVIIANVLLRINNFHTCYSGFLDWGVTSRNCFSSCCCIITQTNDNFTSFAISWNYYKYFKWNIRITSERSNNMRKLNITNTQLYQQFWQYVEASQSFLYFLCERWIVIWGLECYYDVCACMILLSPLAPNQAMMSEPGYPTNDWTLWKYL